MQTLKRTAFMLAVAAMLSGAVCKTVQADETVVTTRTWHDSYGPNRLMLHSGLTTLTVSYFASLVVGLESSHPGDRDLLIPVAGPWLDYANRGACIGACDHDRETVYRVLIVTDGVIQGLAALQIVAGLLLFPETTRVQAQSDHVDQGFTLRAVPLLSRSQVGLGAIARF